MHEEVALVSTSPGRLPGVLRQKPILAADILPPNEMNGVIVRRGAVLKSDLARRLVDLGSRQLEFRDQAVFAGDFIAGFGGVYAHRDRITGLQRGFEGFVKSGQR